MTSSKYNKQFDLKQWKLTVLIIAASLCSTLVLAQSSVTVGFNYQRTKPRGGFEYSEPLVSRNLRTTIGYERQESKRFGFYANFTTGHKTMIFYYPWFYSCVVGQVSHVICVVPEDVTQDQVFRFVETSVGASVFFGRIVRLRIGPYLAYNGIATTQAGLGVNGNIYYPSRMEDMYRRAEFGGHAQLALVLPLGQHWFIQANGFLARSFSDLRKDKWADATAVLEVSMEEAYVEMRSKKLTNHYRSFGLSVGFTW